MPVVELPCDRSRIQALEEQILAGVDQHGYPRSSRFAIKLALEEAVTNAFKHGHRDCPDRPIRVAWEIGPDRVRIEVEDFGPGFRPEEVPDPTLDENLALPSGRGLMLIRAYMTEVRHNPEGNRVTMEYRRAPDAA